MQERIDALAGSGSRYELFAPSHLSTEVDETLQRLVDEVAALAHAPVAAVTLVMDRIQYFRAHVGLPPDLAAARGTDRDASFCQLVVQTRKLLEVPDAARDPRVPQALVRSHGIRAYLGAPLFVDGEALGALCVIDTTPRTFTPEERIGLRSAAKNVSNRLQVLADTSKGERRTLQVLSVQASFGELRNHLSATARRLERAAYERAQLAPLTRLLRSGLPLTDVEFLRNCAQALAALEGHLEQAEGCNNMAQGGLTALQAALAWDQNGAVLSEAVAQATILAHHHTKLTGGVEWPSSLKAPSLVPRHTTVVATISTILLGLADLRWRSGLPKVAIQVERTDDDVGTLLSFMAQDATAAELEELGQQLDRLLRNQPGLQVRLVPGAMLVRVAHEKVVPTNAQRA